LTVKNSKSRNCT